MFNTLAEPTSPNGDFPTTKRGRWKLVWRRDTVVDGRTNALHGTVSRGGLAVAGAEVIATGSGGDLHRTFTRADGTYAFTKLDRASRYDITVEGHVRTYVELVAGPEGWHGEDFAL